MPISLPHILDEGKVTIGYGNNYIESEHNKKYIN